MKTLFSIAFITITFTFSFLVSAQDYFTPVQLETDFKLFRQALEEAHPGLYRYTSKNEFDQLFDATEKELNHNMSAQEFFTKLSPLISEIGCGHTKLHPENKLNTFFYFNSSRVFPLQLFFQDQKAFIIQSYDPEIQIKPGLEILSIDGSPIPDIINMMMHYLYSDGRNTTFKYLELGKYFSALYANVTLNPKPENEPYILVCQDGDKKVSIEVPPVSPDVIELFENQDAKLPPLRLEFIKENMALLTISSFWVSKKDQHYKKFLKESFHEINHKGIQNLIIDVRNNEGGKDAWGSLLLSYLMRHEYHYYDSLVASTNKKYSFSEYAKTPKFYSLLRKMITKTEGGTYQWKKHKNLKIQKPNQNPFDGNVFVLINGASFSVTAEFSSVTHYLKRATFIGEETGGGYFGNNSGTFVIVTLPNTRLSVGIPMLAYYTAVKDYPYPDRGTLPDHEVKLSITDVLENNDKTLEYCIRLIEE